MQKKLYLVPVIALILTVYPVRAASPSPSPSPTPSVIDDSQTVSGNLKKRLQESISTPEVSSITTLNTLGYIGKIKDIIKDTVIMEDKDGKKDIKLTTTTNIVRSPGSTTIKPEDMRIDDYIIAIGIPKEMDVLEAKRLIVSIDPIQNSTKSTGFGTISKISKTTLTLLIDGSEKTITINSKTIYKSSVATIDFSDLSRGDTIIYTAAKDENDILTASVIMRVKTASVGE